MSTKVSSGVSLSTNYFLRNFYTNNQKAAKTSGRSGYSNVELSYEDSRALNRAAKRLSKSDFGSDTDEKDDDLNDTSKAAIEAFVDTYNYTVTSGKSSSDYETKRYVKQLNTLSKKHADELEDLGITINSDGTLDLNKDLLKTANNSKARKLLSSDQEYPQKLVFRERFHRLRYINDVHIAQLFTQIGKFALRQQCADIFQDITAHIAPLSP